jgi:hypothetical protein
MINNKDRAQRARNALLIEYFDELHTEGLETAISDLICDLLHLHMQDKNKNLSTDMLIRRTTSAFIDEVEEEIEEKEISEGE